MLEEVSNPSLGSQAMIRAILLECMIEMLRLRLMAKDNALAWMAALKDPTVWRALKLMLDEPGQAHTVENLADAVGMSRSAFAKRFSDAYGSGPMELLRDLRVRMAGALLKDTDLPVKRIAEMVGFSSRSAFSRMFETKTDLSPRNFRAAHPKNT
jgi:transcriptional regulator GlxA family with amidase domain